MLAVGTAVRPPARQAWRAVPRLVATVRTVVTPVTPPPRRSLTALAAQPPCGAIATRTPARARRLSHETPCVSSTPAASFTAATRQRRTAAALSLCVTPTTHVLAPGCALPRSHAARVAAVRHSWQRRMSGRASTAAASDSERDLTALHEHMAATHGVEPYPQFTPTHSMAAFIAEWEDALEPGARVDNVEVRIAGRVTAKRDASNKLVFYDLSGPIGPDGETHTVQLMAARNRYEGPATASGTQSEQALHAEFSLVNHALRRGDVIGVRGLPGKSKKGQLSVLPVEISLLSPCLPNLPDTKGEGGSERLKDKEARHRQRYLDLLVNGSSREVFAKRSAITRALRDFLHERGFMEVETPILFPSAGGATAKAFETHARAFDADVRLRVAPELFLKQLVVGGFDRVFELAKVFRNEGVTPLHNPEFTMCELYQAYATRDDLMALTEDMLEALARTVSPDGGTVVTVRIPSKGKATEDADGGGDAATPATAVTEVNVDFAGPYRRVSIMPALAEAVGAAGAALPDPNDPASAPELLAILKAHGVECPPPHTPARLVDKLVGRFLEPQCVQPTFLCDHPVAMSPLARADPAQPGCVSRFELFVAGHELCNAYAELNDPSEQRARFSAQEAQRDEGDDEAQSMDEAYCQALEYGLPPTGGWGMGIDRLVMMLTGTAHVRDAILFPLVKPRSAAAAAAGTGGGDVSE